MKHFRIACALLLCLVASVADAQEDITTQEEAAFKAAAAAVAPCVLRIETFGGSEKVGGVLVGSGPTTGLAISEDGYILSSAFNFVQKPSSILVTMPSGKRVAAQIVARDHSRMLVLLKVQSDETLTVPTTVARNELKVGQWALAVGRTFDQTAPNVSVGVISATNRVWSKAIQADAKISPSNYGGPLVDLQGRVMGILVPMSPQGQGEVAGAEWYDSGIGFAVPLDELLPRLEKLKAGTDLHPGLIGISMKNGDMNADPAVIMACQPRGPADKAGLKAQDKIVLIDNLPIQRQAQLKHALGAKYAGDIVRVTVERGSERIEEDLELAEKLEPYQHPFLGVLPMRDPSDLPGVRVRFVFEGSPAAAVGLTPGDRITKLAEAEIKNVGALAEALAAHEPGEKLLVQFVRADKEQTVELTLTALTAVVPPALPSAHGELAAVKEQPNLGLIEVKIPEEKNECAAYVPATYHADAPVALLVALHTPGKYDRNQLLTSYKSLCDDHGVILLLPKAADVSRWDNNDVGFIKKAVDDIAGHYAIDRSRIAVTGYQAAGTMAWLTALSQPESFRAVAAVEAPLPQRAKLPESDPAQRHWFYLAASAKSPQKSAIAATEKRLQDLKLPVIKHDTGATVRELTAAELSELGRWLDSLDRL